MKVVGIGLGKTGTTTLAHCLQYWGLRHRSFNRAIYDIYARGDLAKIMRVVDAYDSFDDHPWPELYREIDARYPGSKFILTTRKDPETWLKSLETKTLRRAERTRVWHIFGMQQGEFDAEKALQHYQRHNNDARAYFKDRPNDFLEVCWERGDNWDRLAPFLGKPIPTAPFPHANKVRGDTEFRRYDLLLRFVPRFVRKGIKALFPNLL